MEAQFLIAGFGGQGVLLIGQLLAKAAMHEGMNVSWMPSYGPEMRGGEANCAVVISDEPIGSPLVTEIPFAVIMNKPSMIKFTPAMEKGGVMLYNSSLIDITPDRDDITAIPVDCNGIADQLGIDVIIVAPVGDRSHRDGHLEGAFALEHGECGVE